MGGRQIALDPSRDLAIMDEHKSVFPYHTIWRWATFAFHDATGRIVGLNIGDHETADNKSMNNENCIWLGNRISLIGNGEFELDKKEYMKPWKIRDKSGRVDVAFHPVVDKLEHINLFVAGIHYFQPYGRFTGHIAEDGGSKIPIENVFGVAEMMDTRF